MRTSANIVPGVPLKRKLPKTALLVWNVSNATGHLANRATPAKGSFDMLMAVCNPERGGDRVSSGGADGHSRRLSFPRNLRQDL